MIYQKRIQLTKLALALSIALAGAPALAQNTTSAVGGRVSGPDGAPAAGASVQIIHTESGSVSNVTTDAEGRYIARGLRTGGPYTIIITKNGAAETRDNVYLPLAETVNVDAVVGAPMATVNVASNRARAAIFNRSNMGSGTAISNAQLQTQASVNRNLQDYARADPRISQTDKEQGALTVAGQNARYNTLTVDGVAVNDTFGLENSGSPTSRQPISIEAIQSVQVNVANYDVTQKGYTGGNINAVTKSGTNLWKGGVYYVYRDDRLAGQRYNPANDTYSDPVSFKETTKGVWASGALVKDKFFIYALSEETSSSRASPDFGPIGSSNGTTVAITPGQITQVQDILQKGYGINAGSLVNGGSQFTSREQMLKFDWNISDIHRANLRFQRTTQGEPNFSTFSATALSLDSAYYNQGKEISTTVAQLFSDWTPNFSTELRASLRQYESEPKNNSTLPSIGVSFSGALPAGSPAGVNTSARSINAGTDSSRMFNVLNVRTQDYYAAGNWKLGDHEVKFGVDYQKNKAYNAFLQNIWGNYTFGCDNNLNYSSIAGGKINCATASQPQVEAAVLENLRTGRFTSYTLQVAAPGYTLDDAVAHFDMTNTGLFLQDTWNVNRNLTLSYGFRVDDVGVGGSPITNPRVGAAPVLNNGARQTGGFGYNNSQTVDGTRLFQPRFGFNYNFDTPRRLQLRGGAGLFQGAAMMVWLGNPFQNAGMATQTINCASSATTKCPTTGGAFSTDINKQPTLGGSVPPVASVDILDPSVRQPSIWKANLALDAELPWFGLVAGAEYLYANTKSGVFFQHLNLGAPTAFGTDGRALYWNAAGGLKQSCWAPGNNSVSTAAGCTNTAKALSNASFNNVILLNNTDKGDTRVATLSLSYPMTKGLGWSIAASHTSATEVSNLNSSVANSNFNARATFNPNENVAANSAYLVKNRINALASFEKAFIGAYKTRLGVFYEGRTGRPYSWTFKNDMNGDGVSGNDLLYVPKGFGSGEVVFVGDTATSHANEQRFWDIVNGSKSLRNAAGGAASRNGDFSPWTNSFDVRLSQEIPGMFSRNKASISLDVLNFGNLLNKKWGHINEGAFNAGGAQSRGFVDYAGLDSQGRYVYAVRSAADPLQIRQVKGESQWAMQLTVKYEF